MSNARHGKERRGEDARETIVTIELVSAQQGGACGVHRTHRDSGPGHSGFKIKQSSRGGATTASRLRKHPIYTFTTGARKRCPGERKGHLEYFGLLPSRSVPKGDCNHQLKVLGSGCATQPCRWPVTTLDNGVDEPYYGGPTDAEEGLPLPETKSRPRPW